MRYDKCIEGEGGGGCYYALTCSRWYIQSALSYQSDMHISKIEDGGHFIPFNQNICRSKQDMKKW